jgi:hypothetical protein
MTARVAAVMTAVVLVAAAADPPGRIDGCVVDVETGEGIPRARVSVRFPAPAPGSELREFVLLTADDGTFSMVNVPKTFVSLSADKAGYLGASFRMFVSGLQARAQRAPSESAATWKPVIKLLRQAAIEGTAKDANGDGVASLRLFREITGGKVVIRETVEVDRTGAFRFAPLEPGRYYIEMASVSRKNAFDPPPPLYRRHFFGGDSEWQSAKPIELTPGKVERLAIELQPTPAFRVRGRIGANAESPLVLLLDSTTSEPLGRSFWDDRTRTFTILEVPPGGYVLDAQWSLGGKPYRASMPIRVSDADLDGIVIEPRSDQR